MNELIKFSLHPRNVFFTLETMPTHPPYLCTAIILFCLVLASGIEAGDYPISDARIEQIAKIYGDSARRRINRWRDLVTNQQNAPLSDRQKLEIANGFINEVRFRDDIVHWKKKDYWATPLETLKTNGGDCEDFSIAKFFTLREMGVSQEKLRLTYVKALDYNQAHMVLAYYESPSAIPLILDNLVGQIQPASERQDLLPVYSFNTEGLWVTNARGAGKRVGGAERLSLWNDLIAKMRKESSQ